MADLKESIKEIIRDEFLHTHCYNCGNAKDGMGVLDSECDYCTIRDSSAWVMSDSSADKVAHNILDRIEKDGKCRWHDLRKDPNDLPDENIYPVLVLDGDRECLAFISPVGENVWVDYTTYNDLENVVSWKYI